MPGNSWQNLRSRVPVANPAPASPAAPASRMPDPVANLLRQRQELQANLQRLVTGDNANARDSARFQVPTFAQRQAQQREWERQREAQLQQPRTRANDPEPRRTIPSPQDTMRSSLRNFDQPVGDWMAQRDQEREQLRQGAGSVRTATQPLRDLGNQLHSAGDQLRDLDQRLASEGLEDDRRALKDLGTDKLLKADKTLQKINSVIDAPQKAMDQIDQFWQRRDQQISGAMDRAGPYVDQYRRRLSVESGGSGDLFERMQQNRERALERRREQRKQEQLEQSKRQRAQQRKRDAKEENVHE